MAAEGSKEHKFLPLLIFPLGYFSAMMGIIYFGSEILSGKRRKLLR